MTIAPVQNDKGTDQDSSRANVDTSSLCFVQLCYVSHLPELHCNSNAVYPLYKKACLELPNDVTVHCATSTNTETKPTILQDGDEFDQLWEQEEYQNIDWDALEMTLSQNVWSIACMYK